MSYYMKDVQNNAAKTLMITVESILKEKGYRLGETIGTGSYAKVKAAEFIAPNSPLPPRKLACKIIDKRKAPQDFLMKFLPRELEIIVHLEHPNIIRMHETIDLINRTFIFMEYAESGDLLDFIKKRGALSNNIARRMFHELADAIKYLHAIQIAHRDLKCENIFLDKNYHVKLGDFGFSRSCIDSQTQRRALSHTYCGSAAYAAPEILQGQSYNPKLYDIWSMGCVLYIMLCGSVPFDDSDIKRMIRAQTEGRLRFPTKISDRIDPHAKDLILHMLEPDVTKRANIDKVIKHPWVTGIPNPGIAVASMNIGPSQR